MEDGIFATQYPNVKVFILKIWKDPVWSKVISAVIIGILSLLYSFIASKISNVDFLSAFHALWFFEIKLWVFVLLIFVYLIMYSLVKRLNRKPQEQFLYDEATRQLDVSLFNKIRNELLPHEGSISWLGRVNFAGGSFALDNLNQIDDFEHEASKPDFEFLNPALEQILLELISAVGSFTYEIGGNTFPAHRAEWQTVPSEWEHQQYDRFWNVVNKLNSDARLIHSKYHELIKTGRRLLKV